MSAELLLAGLRFLPAALNAGMSIRPLVQQMLNVAGDGRKPPLSPPAEYAFNVLAHVHTVLAHVPLPLLKDDLIVILKRANEQLGKMVHEGNRAATSDEWDEINGKLGEKFKGISAPGT